MAHTPLANPWIDCCINTAHSSTQVKRRLRDFDPQPFIISCLPHIKCKTSTLTEGSVEKKCDADGFGVLAPNILHDQLKLFLKVCYRNVLPNNRFDLMELVAGSHHLYPDGNTRPERSSSCRPLLKSWAFIACARTMKCGSEVKFSGIPRWVALSVHV